MQGRAFVYTGAREPFEMREFPIPEVAPGAALVRLTLSNICGSDLHGWHGTRRASPRPSWGTR